MERRTATREITKHLNPSWEHRLESHPRIHDMREGVSAWIYDDEGRFGFPRIALEAEGPDWDTKLLQVNVSFADGRNLIGSGRTVDATGADGSRRTVFRGGPLEFRCLEPFRRWSVTFDGEAYETTTEAQIAGNPDRSHRRQVRFEIGTEMVIPPWIAGQLSEEADKKLKEGEATFVGGRRSFEDGIRYEQLCRARGTLLVDDEEHSFTGSGLRIHRQGVRNLQGFSGHVWQSATFPSGRGFGYMWLLPNDYQEGFVYDQGLMVPARVVETSWLTGFVPRGEDVSFVLESELGRTEVEAETAYSVFIPEGEEFPTEGSWPVHWQQAGVRYRWDNEEAYGMMERSSKPEVFG